MLYLPPGEPQADRWGSHALTTEQLRCAALCLRALKTDTNLYWVLTDYSGEQSLGDPLSTLHRTIYPNTAKASSVCLLGAWTALVSLPGMRLVGDVNSTQLCGAVSGAFVNGRDGCGGRHTNNIILSTRHSDMNTVQGSSSSSNVLFTQQKYMI